MPLTTDISHYADIINSRDIMERINTLESEIAGTYDQEEKTLGELTPEQLKEVAGADGNDSTEAEPTEAHPVQEEAEDDPPRAH